MDSITNVPAVIQAAIERQKIDLSKVNLILPTETFGDVLGEFEKVTIEMVSVDPDPKGPDCFALKPSSNKRSLGKRPLMAMANALTLQWDPAHTGGVERTARMSRNKATAAMQKPNGQWVILVAEKVIDLDAIEEELRKNAADDAEKGPIVEWKDNYPVRGKWKNESEKLAHVDREVQRAMIQKKKSRDELGDTGAHLRVIRLALKVKNEYTIEELKKPFAFPHVQIDTDKLLADPRMREAALNNMVSASRSIFGPRDSSHQIAAEIRAAEEAIDVTVVKENGAPIARTVGEQSGEVIAPQSAVDTFELEAETPEKSTIDAAREMLEGYRGKVRGSAKATALLDATLANKDATLAQINGVIDRFIAHLQKAGAA